MASRDAYRNPDREIEERTEDLLGRMTLREKVRQLGCVWSSALVRNNRFDPDLASELLAEGIGQITRIGANTGLRPPQSAEFANDIQKVLVADTRLGIPAIIHEEAVAGYCARDACQFPQAIGLAATFNPILVREMAAVIRSEMLAVGARQALAPVLDIARDPRWGRVEETYGEDAYLSGRLAVAYVRGLQGENLRQGVIATGKHFIGYGLSEGGMNHAPVQLGARELREVYAEPFAAAIREAGLESVMNAYNAVDGVACAASKELLDGLLRDELGFRGTVVADYYSVDLLVRHHHVAADKESAAIQALEAGLDVELPALDCFADPLEEAVKRGVVRESLVDRSVRRVLRQKFALGLFDNPYVDVSSSSAAFDTPAARALARRLAEQSIVLVKNAGLLPLSPGIRLALVGPAADSPRLLQGDYSYPAHTEIVYKRNLLPAAMAPASSAEPPGGAAPAGDFQPGPHYVHMVTPREALSEKAEVHYVEGCSYDDTQESDISAAVAAAASADVAVVCVGGKSGLVSDCTSGEFRDASYLGLTGRQDELISRVAGTGTPLVVVVIGGRAFALEHAAESAGALLMAWLPGEEGGNAIADVLFGDANPSGRLPLSLARTAGQVPVYYNHRSGGGRSAPYGDYVDLNASPLYPFGHGLSYSRFEYADVTCPNTVDTHGVVDVLVPVTNVSDVAGEEVVQLYIRDKVADVARPVKQLAGFQRVFLLPGQEKTVLFQLDVSQLAYYNREMDYVVDAGQVEIMVGASSADVRGSRTLMVQGETRFLKQQQRLATQSHVIDVE